MLAGAGRDQVEILATMPPRMAPVSVEKVATNAVMAGCLPEYFPVVRRWSMGPSPPPDRR